MIFLRTILLISGLIGVGFSGAWALCVVESNTDLHSGPGPDYPKTSWSLAEYTPLRKLDTWNDWIQVADMDGDEHWVHASAVMSGSYCLAIKVDRTHLYSGPGTEYEMVRVGRKYEVFRFVKRQGKWVQMADETGEGFWVSTHEVWVQ